MTSELSRTELMSRVKYDASGLVPAIAQDAHDGRVLMMAWMNAESLRITLETRKVTYWSRSRQSLWTKGETSGHEQSLVEAWLDCDGDTILLKVNQKGPACHTGSETCFFEKVKL